MIPTPNVAKDITRAVIDRIAADQMCNSENIADAVFRELSAAFMVAEQAKPAAGREDPYANTITLGLQDVADFMHMLSRIAPPSVMHEANKFFSRGLRR